MPNLDPLHFIIISFKASPAGFPSCRKDGQWRWRRHSRSFSPGQSQSRADWPKPLRRRPNIVVKKGKCAVDNGKIMSRGRSLDYYEGGDKYSEKAAFGCVVDASAVFLLSIFSVNVLVLDNNCYHCHRHITSFSSHKSMSLVVRPCRARSLGTAIEGPMPITSGSQPPTTKP